MTLTRYESYNNGYVKKSGSTYTLGSTFTLYEDDLEEDVKTIISSFESDGVERRAFKRFLAGFSASDIIVNATLYWRLVEITGSATTACKLEQISDYGSLEATAGDFDIAATHDYGNVMTYDSTHPAWVSQDITTEFDASKQDAYVAFRWSVASQPASNGIAYFLGAYDETSLKAYISLTLSTGWCHKINALTPAGTAKINGVARTTGIAKVNAL